MKLALYLYKRFFVIFFGAVAFFCLVLHLADLVMNLWRYVSVGASAKDVLKVLFYYIPKTISYSVPISMLFATAFTLSTLYSSNELTAVFACGVSLLRFTFPLLVFSFLMSFAMFVFEDKIVVPSYAKKTAFQKIVMKQEEKKNNDKIVIMSDEGRIIYKADFYDDGAQLLLNIYIVFRDDEKKFYSLIRSDSASWNEELKHWILAGDVRYDKEKENIIMNSNVKELEILLTEPPETFRNNTISVEEVSTKEAKEYIEHLLKAGLPASEALSVYYKKYSFPFVVFIVVFLAIGLSGKTRKNVLLVSLGLSIGAVVLFYIVQMVTMLLAKFALIPPVSGAWLPVILFIIISIILLFFART